MACLPPIQFEHYYTWSEMTGFLEECRLACPDLLSLTEIGTTPEGRPLLCAQITSPGPDVPARPAYLVQAVVHALEVAGTTASLHLIRHLLEQWETDAQVRRLLDEVVFYIVPRMNPDGAEFGLSTGGSIRSRNTPRYRKNGLYQADVDGDGLILNMRIEDPRGNMMPHPQDPRFMIARTAEGGEGPFYFVYNEGLVHDWDGGPIVGAERSADFNRNWGANWRPEYEQWGAGNFPFSQPETRALAEFIFDHPNIYGILGFHCGGNSVLRPPSTGSDDDVDATDLRKMKEIGGRGAELTGFRLRAVIDYRLDESKPIALQGHFHDWGYRHLGLHVFEIELGNIYNSVGVTTEEYFAASDDERRDYNLRALAWSDEKPEKGAFVNWRPFRHPQLGDVEIGGWRAPFVANPLSEDMERICPGCTAFILDHARRRPELGIVNVSAEPVGGGVHRLTATVLNTGDLATQITQIGHKVAHAEQVRVRVQGAEVLSRGAVQEIGQLDGVCGYRDLEWFVRGSAGAELTISASAPKCIDAAAVVRLREDRDETT